MIRQSIKISRLILLLLVIGCGGGSGGGEEASADPAISGQDFPGFAQWEANMINFGRKHCDQAKLQELSTWEGSVWYYDGVRAYYQIAEYTKDSSWEKCAQYVRDVYRPYVLKAQKVPGWRVFPHGLQKDFNKTSEAESKEAVIRLANQSAFAASGGGADFRLSRETAYLIHAYLSAMELGEPEPAALKSAVNYALMHLDQWAVLETADYVQPFMVALTSEALIRYQAKTGDGRVLPAVKRAFEWLWNKAWDESAQSFRYIVCEPGVQVNDNDCSQNKGTADLNLLIAPVYGWLYKQTGDSSWIQKGDQMFLSGVNGSWLDGGKQFSQNYRWSFDYLKWRAGY